MDKTEVNTRLLQRVWVMDLDPEEEEAGQVNFNESLHVTNEQLYDDDTAHQRAER